MTAVAIPAWNSQGLIPPINELQPTAAERSPYTVSLIDFVLRFSQSTERRIVLDGLLRYRAALHSVGLTQGFQWLDGSFLENVELLENRAPNDIDVVTFFSLPEHKSQKDLFAQNPLVFDHSLLKSDFHVDAYLTHLGMASDRLVKQATYWYSMWSHRRTNDWKGYVQIDLAPTEDAAAIASLATTLNPQGAQP